MDKRVVFRLDAGTEYGLGHFSRCFALAQQLLEKQIEVSFYIYGNLNIHLANKLSYNAINIHQIDPLNSLAFLDDIKKSDVVVVDSYEVNEFALSNIKDRCSKLIVIDDFDKAYTEIDAVVNTSISSSKINAPRYRQFLGIDYALLRKEFLVPPAQRQREGILISMGGSDPKNLTLEVLDVLFLLKVSEPIHVLYTTSYSDFQLNHFLRLSQVGLIRTKVNLEPHEIVQLMDECKYGIFPASNSLLEALKRNLICGFGYYTDNQKALYKTLKNSGAGVDFNGFQKTTLKQSIRDLLNLDSPNYFLSGRISSKLSELVNYMLE